MPVWRKNRKRIGRTYAVEALGNSRANAFFRNPYDNGSEHKSASGRALTKRKPFPVRCKGAGKLRPSAGLCPGEDFNLCRPSARLKKFPLISLRSPNVNGENRARNIKDPDTPLLADVSDSHPASIG